MALQLRKHRFALHNKDLPAELLLLPLERAKSVDLEERNWKKKEKEEKLRLTAFVPPQPTQDKVHWSDGQSAAAAAGTSQPWPRSPQWLWGQQDLSQSAPRAAPQNTVDGEKKNSLAPTQDLFRAPDIYIFIPPCVPSAAAPQAPALSSGHCVVKQRRTHKSDRDMV